MIQLQMRKMALDRGHSLKYADEAYGNLCCMQSMVITVPADFVTTIWNHIKDTTNPFLALEAIEESFAAQLLELLKEEDFYGERA